MCVFVQAVRVYIALVTDCPFCWVSFFCLKRFKFPRSLSRGEMSLFLSPSVFNLIFLFHSMTSRNRPGQNSLLANCMTQRQGREGRAEIERRKDGGRRRTWEKEKGRAKQYESDPSRCAQYLQLAPVKPIRLRLLLRWSKKNHNIPNSPSR